MSEQSVNPDETLRLKSGYSEMLALIVAAGGTTLRIGPFATFFSSVLNEYLYGFIDADLTGVQVLSFGVFQAAFALFLVWTYGPQLLAEGRKVTWLAVSAVVGILLVAWLSTYAHQALSLSPLVEPPEKAPGVVLFGSSFWHAAIWVLHAAIFAAAFEALIFQGYMFNALRDLPSWLIGAAVLFFFCMAGGYALGFEGIWIYLKLGSVLVALRLVGGSFVYPGRCCGHLPRCRSVRIPVVDDTGMNISSLRFGFERTAQITGLVAVAFVLSGILQSTFVAPPLPDPPAAADVAWSAALLTLRNSLWHVGMFLLAIALVAPSARALMRAPQKPLLLILCALAALR
jgi:hypothetical protein